MKKTKGTLFIVLLFLLAFILPQPPFIQAKEIELRLAHMFPVGTPADHHIRQWADKVAAESNGRLTIRIFPSNTLIIAPEMYDGVVKGAADIGFAWRYKPTSYTVGVQFPFLLAAPDTVIADKVYTDIWKEFPDLMANEWKDVKILWLEPSVPVYLFSRKPIAKLEDLKGQQIRVPSKELAGLVKEMGAAPAFMSAADFIVGLDKGTVDGACGLFAMIPDYKLGGKIKSVVMISLGVSVPVMVIMNKNAFSKLPEDLQGVLEKTSKWGKADSIQYWSKFYDDSMTYCKNNNIDLVYPSPQEKARWVQMIQSSREKAAAELDGKGYPGTRILHFINERIEYYEKMK